MDFKVNRETIAVSECIYDGLQEQALELDYILPDYFPDIFRLIRCEAVPTVTDYTVNGDKLNYELRCDIRIIYCSETGSALQCINQKQTFSRTVDLGKFCENPSAELKPKTDYVNYRAVNKRRLDLRGAVSVRICVTGEKKQEVICDAFGMNIKLKKTPVNFAGKKISAVKSVQISEEIEITQAQPPAINIIRCICQPVNCEKKLISGKIMAKGEVLVKLLYSCEKDGRGAAEPLEFTVPFSQIMDVEGLDGECEAKLSADTVYCEAVPSVNKEGENRIIKFEAEVRLEYKGVQSVSVMLGTDAYSTTYPCKVSSAEIKAEQIPVLLSREIHNMAKLCEGESVPEEIYDLWCTPKNINTRLLPEEKKLVISGMLTYTMAGRDSSGLIAITDKEEAFEETVELDERYEGTASAEVRVKNVSYNITAENTLSAKADVSANISLCTASAVKALSEIEIDDSVKKIRDGDYALKLYYGVEDEDIWDIAKRYSTSVDAIMEENDLLSERLERNGMLIIPMVL